MITLTAKITLADGTEIPINKKNALSIDESIIDRGDIILPSWGIISNGGSISFMDYDGKIKKLAQNLKLTSKTKVDIYLNNTNCGCSVSVGEFVAEKWNYENNSSEVNISISDGLTKMQDINITPLEYHLENSLYYYSGKLIYDFLQRQSVKNGFNFISTSDENFDSKTLKHLENISFVIPYIQEMNLWRAWQDFAVAFQLHIYKNSEGVIVCIYNGGD